MTEPHENALGGQLTPALILRLQRVSGNQAVLRLLRHVKRLPGVPEPHGSNDPKLPPGTAPNTCEPNAPKGKGEEKEPERSERSVRPKQPDAPEPDVANLSDADKPEGSGPMPNPLVVSRPPKEGLPNGRSTSIYSG